MLVVAFILVPECPAVHCVRLSDPCEKEHSYPEETEYVRNLEQATADDAFPVQMASIANRINNLASPVAGWDLVRHWDIGATEAGCKYLQYAGIYRRTQNDSDVCVLSFSSMDFGSGANFSTNFNPSAVPSWCGFEQVHKGYAKRVSHFMNGTRYQEFLGYFRQNCSQGVVLTGHSMGGALATLLAACASKDNIFNVRALYTFGTPGVTKVQLENSQSEDGCFQGYRFYSMNSIRRDPIPVMSSPFGYKHPKLKEFRIKEGWGDSFENKVRDCGSDHARDNPRAKQKWGETFTFGFFLHSAKKYINRLLRICGVQSQLRAAGDRSYNRSAANEDFAPSGFCAKYFSEE